MKKVKNYFSLIILLLLRIITLAGAEEKINVLKLNNGPEMPQLELSTFNTPPYKVAKVRALRLSNFDDTNEGFHTIIDNMKIKLLPYKSNVTPFHITKRILHLVPQSER